MKKPFKLDPILETMIFHVQSHIARGKGEKVTMPKFTSQLAVRLEMVHQLHRPAGDYRAKKGKGQGKRNSPQQAEPKEGEIMAPPQQGEENIQGPKNIEDTHTQGDPKVLLVAQGNIEVELEVQEVSPPQKIEKDSPCAPKRRKIKNLVKRSEKVIKKVIPFPSIPKPILE